MNTVHKLLHKLGLVLGFTGIEAHILNEHNISILHSIHSSLDLITNNLVHLGDLGLDQLTKTSSHLPHNAC